MCSPLVKIGKRWKLQGPPEEFSSVRLDSCQCVFNLAALNLMTPWHVKKKKSPVLSGNSGWYLMVCF